ncbi:MAG: response regulator transcription factor, partial [Leptospiraceae bacterium]|nr:response regulator transcription factor [Leptospiraceae bacterium]
MYGLELLDNPMTEQPKQKKQQTTDPIQIGLVENDPDYHRRIESELNSLDDPYKLRIWNSAESFWRDAAARKLDLLLLDIKLPGMDGVELAGRVAERDEHIRIVMLSNMNSDRLIFQALRNGAVGYILKSELNDIPATVRTIMDGGAIITPTIAYRVMSSFKKTNPVMGAGLTEREKQVLEL